MMKSVVLSGMRDRKRLPAVFRESSGGHEHHFVVKRIGNAAQRNSGIYVSPQSGAHFTGVCTAGKTIKSADKKAAADEKVGGTAHAKNQSDSTAADTRCFRTDVSGEILYICFRVSGQRMGVLSESR